MPGPTSTPPARDPADLLLVGRVGRAHGVRGEVKMRPETDDPDRLRDVETLYLGTDPEAVRPHAVASVRMQQVKKKGTVVVLGLADVDGRDAAMGLKGLNVYAHPDDLPALDEDEFFLHDLVGLAVVTVDGDAVGTVRDVMDLPAHDVLVIDRGDQPDAMVPAVAEFIDDIDLEAGTVAIRPIAGLLD